MTTIRHIERETSVSVRDGGKLLPIVVELHPGFMILRQKGCRKKYTLAYDAAYQYAAKLAARDDGGVRR